MDGHVFSLISLFIGALRFHSHDFLNCREFKSQVCTSQALSESHKLPEQITVRERLVTGGASGVGIHIEGYLLFGYSTPSILSRAFYIYTYIHI